MTAASAPHRPVVALTGATGFIGNTVLIRLLQAGWHVRALYRPRRGRDLPALAEVEWLAGDLDDDGALATLVAGSEVVVHCAGVVRGAYPADFDRVNVEGVRHLVVAAARQAGCRRFLLLSSLAARAPALSDYAASKRRGEHALADAAAGLRWSVLRPPAVYGPGDRELLPLWRGIAHGFALAPAGGPRRLSLLYVEDLASAIVDWLGADVGAGETFEVEDGTVNGYDWATLVTIARRASRATARVWRVPVPVALLRAIGWVNLLAARVLGYAPMLTPGKVREITHPDWVADSTAFTRATGWRPRFDLERGLARLFGRSAPMLDGVA